MTGRGPGDAPDCSVVIPTYNRAPLLRRTLEALTRQTLPVARFEVLVVDDGSSDSTAQVADEFRGRLNLRCFFREDEGWRVAHARNIGVANAAGEICVFVDTGVLLHSGGLQAHLDCHRSAPGPMAVNGYTYGFTWVLSQLEDLSRNIDFDDADAAIEAIRAAGKWDDAREPFYAEHGDDYGDLPAPWVMFFTCNASARTEQIRAVGAFDEHFQSWGGEDIDLGYRLFLDGARSRLDRAACAVHYPHRQNYLQPGVRESANENCRYIARKYGTPITRLLRFFDIKINPFNINEIALRLGLPRCQDYIAERGAEAAAEVGAPGGPRG